MPRFDFVLASRYKLVAPLGEGGMATVYRARDLRLNRDIAIKVLREELTRDPGFLTRFEREAQTVASLAHPNIVPVYDVGEEEGAHFIVMEYVRGRTLREALDLQGPFAPDRAISVAERVLDALSHAHAHGLVHRDVKPHNILLAADGTPRLADFGIAHLVGGSTTRTAAILGSAHYLSPEQSRGEEASVRSDIYACGIVLYEMLAGHPPFDGPNALAIAHQHLHEAPPRIPSAPPGLWKVIARSLAKDPAARPPDAQTFAADLRALAAQTGTETAAQPLDPQGTSSAPLVLEMHDFPTPPRGAGAHPVRDERLVLRRSARKSYLLAFLSSLSVGAAAYTAAVTGWGQDLPQYPSAPYALVPAFFAAVTAITWLNTRSWIYTLDGNAAIVQWGLLAHHRFGVPLRSIAALELKQTPLDRLVGVGTIEMAARDTHGREQRVIMEDVARPRDTYEELVKLVGRSVRYRPGQ